ncbi:FAD binding domain-containing protein [Feifania hominis]|uniref:FAD binding domain-containing protein n=1 Tax=Feifania hominis TaxID=2763660 RepID=A0A926HU05_9FIRM|nr:FAD binding domain-containing protein [Feifania hominis]MBC8535818.1 FAD binding domain-containing protein [Feifania hominis]
MSIPVNFKYIRPDTLQQACSAYDAVVSQNETPLFYAGGSEIISMARVGSIAPAAVVDLKGIPECTAYRSEPQRLVIGSCVTLSQIREAGDFPLLGEAGGRIADHTNQTRITLGGNVCGTIVYREAVLPLLLADAAVCLCGPDGERTAPIAEVFDERLRLGPGEFVTQFAVEKKYCTAPFVHVKKMKNEKIGYPLLTICAMKVDGSVRLAFSGLLSYPFRSRQMETAANDRSLGLGDRVRATVEKLPQSPMANLDGSAEYRLFVLENTLLKTLQRMEEL